MQICKESIWSNSVLATRKGVVTRDITPCDMHLHIQNIFNTIFCMPILFQDDNKYSKYHKDI